MGYEVDFMPSDKYESFLQIDRITLHVRSKPWPNYQK